MDYQRWRNIYNTLPFSHLEVPWHVCRDSREQTKRRWHWFTDAKQLDEIRATELGTLNYLPWELERLVLLELVPRSPIDTSGNSLSFDPRFYCDDWAFVSLPCAARRLSPSVRDVLDTMVRRDYESSFPHFDNNDHLPSVSGKFKHPRRHGRLELRRYFSTHEPRSSAPFIDDYLKAAVAEDDLVETFTGGDILDVKPRYSRPLGDASEAAVDCLREASHNLREELEGSFLSAYEFFFDSPEIFEQFCTSPMVFHAQNQCRISIIIGILSMDDEKLGLKQVLEYQRMARWHGALESLPPKIQTLGIYLRYRKKAPEAWQKHFWRLEMILKKCKRHAPEARILLGVNYIHRTVDDLCRSSRSESESLVVLGIRDLLLDDET